MWGITLGQKRLHVPQRALNEAAPALGVSAGHRIGGREERERWGMPIPGLDSEGGMNRPWVDPTTALLVR